MPKGTKLGYSAERFATDKTIAVVPLGFADGYPRLPVNGQALAGGRRVAIIGPRNAEYTTLDITGIPGLSVGAEAVFMGRQGDEEITVKDLADAVGVPAVDLIPRLLRNSRKVYL
jgi:alanine racemase